MTTTTDATIDTSGISPEASTDLSPEQIASAREHWTSLGYEGATFDQALADEPARQGEPTQAGGDPTAIAQTDSAGLTPAQAREMAEELVKAGVPREQVEAALRADGLEPPAPDTRTDEQREIDEWFGPAPAASDYHPDYVNRIPADAPIEALTVFHAAATSWASAVGFPPAIGAAVIERAMDVGHTFTAMSEAEQGLWKAEQPVLFEHMAGGPEKAEARAALALKAMERSPKEFLAILRQTGAAFDAGIVMHLANQEERRAARG